MYGLKRNLPTRSDLKHIFFKNLFRVRSMFNFENFSLILKKGLLPKLGPFFRLILADKNLPCM